MTRYVEPDNEGPSTLDYVCFVTIAACMIALGWVFWP